MIFLLEQVRSIPEWAEKLGFGRRIAGLGVLIGSSFLMLNSTLYGLRDFPASPEAIQRHVDYLEARFETAEGIFNPWYTGPLLTPSAYLIPPGKVNLQPYFFITTSHAIFDQSGKARTIPRFNQLLFSLNIQTGIFDWMDVIFVVKGLRNSNAQYAALNLGDSLVTLGFRLLKETPHTPAIKLSLQELFPTGNYQHLDPKKKDVDASGIGVYQTTAILSLSKTVWWLLMHPMNFRLSSRWNIPATSKISGETLYGGGNGTRGKIRLGNGVSFDFGWQFSLNQPWVLTLDVIYFYLQKTTFSGNPGISASGRPNHVGIPYLDQLSLAPGIEYNLNENFGFVGGYWFAAWGRNSPKFSSGVASFCWTF